MLILLVYQNFCEEWWGHSALREARYAERTEGSVRLRGSRFRLITAFALTALLPNFVCAITIDDLRALPWEGVALAAVAISAALIALIFALSKLFAVHEFEAWSKNEIWQVVGMAVLVAIVLGIDKIEGAVFGAVGAPKPIEAGMIYLERVRTFVSFRMAELSLFGTALGAFFGPLEQKVPPEPRWPWPYWEQLPAVRQYEYIFRSQIVGTLFTALGGAATVTTAQIYFLKYFVGALLLPLVLPLGIVLRALPFARGLGAALIAIALGFYFVYPLTLVASAQILARTRGARWWSVEIIPKPVLDFLGITDPAAPVLGAVGALPPRVLRLARAAYASPVTFLAFASVIMRHTINLLYEHAAFSAVVLGALLPFLSIVITFGVTRELAALLGTDVELSTFMRIL